MAEGVSGSETQRSCFISEVKPTMQMFGGFFGGQDEVI